MSSFNVSWMHMAGNIWLIELTVINVDSEADMSSFNVSWMHMAGVEAVDHFLLIVVGFSLSFP